MDCCLFAAARQEGVYLRFLKGYRVFMRRQVLFLVVIGVLVPAMVEAQETGSIRGTVTDAQTEDPIPGANVTLSSLGRGTSTNDDGAFVIKNVSTGTYTLRATFVGYKDRTRDITVRAKENTTVRIKLKPGNVKLDAVVVTGQGTAIDQKRLSTTASTVTAEEVESVSTSRIDQALQAQLSHTQIRLNSGQPGTTSLIRNRGPKSADGVTTPVIYVDGVRVDNRSTGSRFDIDTGGARSSSIADIPMQDIDRVEYISGSAAATIYGSDAANGVLQIFTEDGKGDDDQIHFQTKLGAEYGTDQFFRFDRSGEVLFEDPALIQSYRLSGKGGRSGLNYSFSGKMHENKGARVGNDQVRYDVHTSLSATPLNNVQYSGSLNFVHTNFTRARNANSSFAQIFQLESAGLFEPEGEGSGVVIDSLSRDRFEVVKDSLRRSTGLYQNETSVSRFIGSQRLRYNPTANVEAQFTGGVDFRQEQNEEILTNRYLASVGSPESASSLVEFNRTFLGLTLRGNVSHTFDWRFLNVQSNVGGDVFRDETRISRLEADEVPDGTETVLAGSDTRSQDARRVVAQRGAYVKENVGFGDRFFIDLGLRVDENTAFGDDTKPQWYPAAGVSYVVTDEPVVEQAVPDAVLSRLKLRANYGETGKFPEPFSRDRLTDVYSFQGESAYTFGAPGDPTLEPERVRSFEIGADATLVNDRVSLQVTRYRERTEDALFRAPFAPSTGQDDQVRNIGVIENKGWEIAGEFSLLDQSEYELTVSASLNTLNNEVVDNGTASKFETGGFRFLRGFVDEGKPIGYFEGNQAFFDDQGRVDSVAVDQNLGNPNPDQFGSLGLRARWKGVRLRVTADYQRGAQGVNLDEPVRYIQLLRTQGRVNTLTDGRLPNPNNEPIPPAAQQDVSFSDLSNVFVEDTDYLKIRNISLDYRLPERVLPSRIRSVRIGGSVTNPFSFTASTFDPEISGSSTAAGRAGGAFGFSTISPPRRYTFTLDIGI